MLVQDSSPKKCGPACVLRWIARIWSIASIVLILVFIIGERSCPSGLGEWIGFLFFPVGVAAGMIISWWKEGEGGGITVASLIFFYLIHLATAGRFPEGWGWLAFSAPGFLFLVTWCWSTKCEAL